MDTVEEVLEKYKDPPPVMSREAAVQPDNLTEVLDRLSAKTLVVQREFDTVRWLIWWYLHQKNQVSFRESALGEQLQTIVSLRQGKKYIPITAKKRYSWDSRNHIEINDLDGELLEVCEVFGMGEPMLALFCENKPVKGPGRPDENDLCGVNLTKETATKLRDFLNDFLSGKWEN